MSKSFPVSFTSTPDLFEARTNWITAMGQTPTKIVFFDADGRVELLPLTGQGVLTIDRDDERFCNVFAKRRVREALAAELAQYCLADYYNGVPRLDEWMSA